MPKIIISPDCQRTPSIEEPPQNQTKHVGENAVFSCVLYSGTTVDRQWRFLPTSEDNAKYLPVSWDRSGYLTVPNVTFASAGKYTCIVRINGEEKECHPEASAFLTVLPPWNATFLTVLPAALTPRISSAYTYTLLGLLAGGFLLFFWCCIWIGCKKRTKGKVPYDRCPSNTSSEVPPLSPGFSIGSDHIFFPFQQSPMREVLATWNPLYQSSDGAAKTRLFLGKEIGYGQFGSVLKGELQAQRRGEAFVTKRTVAVKTMIEYGREEELQAELDVMQSVPRHPNIVELIPCYVHLPSLAIVMEFAERGNLKKLLTSSRDLPNADGYIMPRDDNHWVFTYHDQLDAARQIAAGMAHLASHGILHRDLAARNVLVTADYVMKISDFGLSRAKGNKDYYRMQPHSCVSLRWIAPEVLREGRYTTDSDIWSYGVLLWEIMTLGETPYGSEEIQPDALLGCLATGHRLTAPESCPADIHNLMAGCWNSIPLERPTFSQIENYLLVCLDDVSQA